LEIRPPKYLGAHGYIPDRLITVLAEHVRRYRPGDDPDRWLFPGTRNATVPAHAATVARSSRFARDAVGMLLRTHCGRRARFKALTRV
jgi:hypothetical protein